MTNNTEISQILKNINNLKNLLISNLDNNKQIIKQQLVYNDVKIPLEALTTMNFAMKQEWFTDVILARLFSKILFKRV